MNENIDLKNTQGEVFQSKYRNIIFDLGAVLVYFNAHEIINDVFKDEEQKPYELFQAMKTTECLDWDRGLRTPHEVADLLSERYDKEKLKRFLTAIPDYLYPLNHGLDLFDTIRQKGYKTYALSNIAQECHAKISQCDFFKKLDGAVLSYQVKAAKPDKEIYDHLLCRYGLVADECLFIDDLPENIVGAKAVGIDGIVLKNHEQVMQDLRVLKIL